MKLNSFSSPDFFLPSLNFSHTAQYHEANIEKQAFPKHTLLPTVHGSVTHAISSLIFRVCLPAPIMKPNMTQATRSRKELGPEISNQRRVHNITANYDAQIETPGDFRDEGLQPEADGLLFGDGRTIAIRIFGTTRTGSSRLRSG